MNQLKNIYLGFDFFNHIINIPEKLNYKIDKICLYV